jgi:hypothetical protein
MSTTTPEEREYHRLTSHPEQFVARLLAERDALALKAARPNWGPEIDRLCAEAEAMREENKALAAEVERWRNATYSATPEDLSRSVADSATELTELRLEVERLKLSAHKDAFEGGKAAGRRDLAKEQGNG